MAHNYVISSISRMGDTATVTGTVDGVPVTLTCNFSAITQLPSVAAVQAFLATLMLPVAVPSLPVIINTYNGSFSQ